MAWSMLFRRTVSVLLLLATTLAVASAGCVTPPWRIPSPEEGKSNAWGQVMWNDQPVAGADVEIGTGITTYLGVEGKTELNEPVYKAITDSKGYYLFANVEPGGYVRRVRAFGDWLYPDGKLKYEKSYIKAGQTVCLSTCHLVKDDLKLNTPAHGATVAQDKLVLTWEAYPGARHYTVRLISVYTTQLDFESGRTTETSYVHPQPLLNGEYTWSICAYNQNSRLIASSGYSRFTITGAVYTYYIKIISPLSGPEGLSGTGLTLRWEPYPGATYYKVHVATSNYEYVVNFVKVTDTSYKIPESLKSGTYPWGVTAYNSSDKELAGSGFNEFTVK